MTVAHAQQLAQQGNLPAALAVLAPLLRSSPPPRGANLEYARIAAPTPFKFLALEAAQKEAQLYPHQETTDLIAGILNFSSQNRQTRTDLPLISLIAVSSSGQEHDWLRCLASLSHQMYSHIEVVLLSESPRSAWPDLPPFVAFTHLLAAPASRPSILAQGIREARGEVVSVIERPRTVFSDMGLLIVASIFHGVRGLEALQGQRLQQSDRHIFKPTRMSEPSWSQASLLDLLTLEPPTLLFSWRGVFFRKEALVRVALPFRADIQLATALEAALKISRTSPICTVSAPILLDDAPIEAKSFCVSPQEKAEALALINDEKSRLSSAPSRESPPPIQPFAPQRQAHKLPTVSQALLLHGAAAAPTISVVTPVFNCAEYIERCIDSVLSQKYKNLEYIILDAGSTDGTQEIIKRYEKHFAYWRSGPDAGHYAAVQEGLARSTGSIMSWINADDVLTPYSLHLVAAILSAQPSIEWITGQACTFSEERELHIGGYITPQGESYYDDGFDEPFIQQEGTFWKRGLWERSGASLDLTLPFAADMELWTRFFAHTRLFSTTVPLGIFQRRAGQRSSVFRARYFREAYTVIQRLRASGLKPFRDASGDGTLITIPAA